MTMDDSEKLMALKKAYAEIILNTTKEAAVRIMESERKAMRFQQELSVAKEEALIMLMRLKQMLDAKASEAELVSIAQQKKMEELEAQVQEAEDIVKELREDLREVQAELERQSPSQIPASKRNCTEKCCTQQDAFGTSKDNFELSDSRMTPELVTVSNTKNFTLNGSHEGSDCYPKDLSSVLIRLKDTGFGINRYSQRIRACKSDLDGEQVKRIQCEPNQENEKFENVSGTTKLSKEEKKHEMEESNWIKKRNYLGVLKSFRKKRKRSTRFRGAKTSSFMSIGDIAIKMQNLSCSGNSVDSSSAPIFSSDGDKVIIQTGRSDLCTDPEICRSSIVEQSNENAKASAESHPIEHDKPPAEASCLAADSNKLNSSHSLNTKADKANEVQSPTSKVIKYTFQRKRRRGDVLSSTCHNRIVEEKDEKNKTVSHGILEPKSQIFKSESSRDSRRLVQVARQLISLSEKK